MRARGRKYMKEKIYGIVMGIVIMGFLTMMIAPTVQGIHEDGGDKFSKEKHAKTCYGFFTSVGYEGVGFEFEFEEQGDHGAGLAIGQIITETIITDPNTGIEYEYPVNWNAPIHTATNPHYTGLGDDHKYEVTVNEYDTDRSANYPYVSVITDFGWQIKHYTRGMWPWQDWELEDIMQDWSTSLEQGYYCPGGPMT